jgi:hypothetical protein
MLFDYKNREALADFYIPEPFNRRTPMDKKVLNLKDVVKEKVISVGFDVHSLSSQITAPADGTPLIKNCMSSSKYIMALLSPFPPTILLCFNQKKLRQL